MLFGREDYIADTLGGYIKICRIPSISLSCAILDSNSRHIVFDIAESDLKFQGN